MTPPCVRGLVIDVLYAHGFNGAAEEIEARRRGPNWGAWHVEQRIPVYGERAQRCYDALLEILRPKEDA